MKLKFNDQVFGLVIAGMNLEKIDETGDIIGQIYSRVRQQLRIVKK
jgi:hypothetical protein